MHNSTKTVMYCLQTWFRCWVRYFLTCFEQLYLSVWSMLSVVANHSLLFTYALSFRYRCRISRDIYSSSDRTSLLGSFCGSDGDCCRNSEALLIYRSSSSDCFCFFCGVENYGFNGGDCFSAYGRNSVRMSLILGKTLVVALSALAISITLLRF